MKKLFYSLSAFVALGFCTSCDANKGKVADLAEKFIQAIEENDKIQLYEIYPNVRQMEVVEFPKSVGDDIDVEFDETDSVYIAKFNDKQSLIVKKYGEDKFQIIDSYQVFKLDSLTYELAAKVGAPVKSKSDLWNAKYFDDDSHFISWLGYNSSKIISTDNGYYWSNGRIEERVTNHSKHSFGWDEYSIQYEFKNRKTGEIVATHTVTGSSLAPGESYTESFRKEGLSYYASRSLLSWGSSKIVFKEKYQAHAYAKFGEFKGDEYSRHVNRYAHGIDTWQWLEDMPNLRKEHGFDYGFVITGLLDWANSAYGFEIGDVLVEVDGKQAYWENWEKWRDGKKKGDTAKFKIIRDKKEMILDVVLYNPGDTIPAL
jgi:hypothetical protein